MYYIFFIHLSIDGDLGCFHVLAIVNSAAMNIGVHISFIFDYVWSSLLHTCFLQFWLLAATLHRSAQASRGSGIPCGRIQAPHGSGLPCGRAQARAQAQQLWHTAQFPQVMRTPSGPGIQPVFPELAGGFLTTRLPGKSACIFLNYNFVCICLRP